MSDTVVSMDAYRPHIVISADGKAYVVSVQDMLNIASGVTPIAELPDYVWRRVLIEWLQFIRAHDSGIQT